MFVLLIGAWDAVPVEQQGLRIREAVIQRSPPDSRFLQEAVTRWRPDWLLPGTEEEEGALARAAAMRGMLPSVRLAVLGPAKDAEQCERWVRRGASVYLDAGASAERVVAALHAAAALDLVVIDAGLHRATLAEQRGLHAGLLAAGGLSAQELEVLRLLWQGHTNTDIAAALHLSVKTVEFHIRNILTKLGVSNRTQAAQRARLLGL